MRSLAIFVLCALLTVTLCGRPAWEYCGDPKNPPKYEATVVDIGTNATTDSNGQMTWNDGTYVTMFMYFKMTGGTALNATSVFNTTIHPNLKYSIPIQNPNACKDSGLVCPLKAPMDYVYILTFKVWFPWDLQLRFVLNWYLTDQNGKAVWCVIMPVQHNK